MFLKHLSSFLIRKDTPPPPPPSQPPPPPPRLFLQALPPIVSTCTPPHHNSQPTRLQPPLPPSIQTPGTSAYGFNPASGRINRHVDTWDSITNQQYFSLEAFGDFFKQLLQPYTTPALGTPTYTLLK